MKEHTKVASPHQQTSQGHTKVGIQGMHGMGKGHTKVGMLGTDTVPKVDLAEGAAGGEGGARNVRRGGTATRTAAWVGVALMSSLGAIACRSGGPDSTAGRGGPDAGWGAADGDDDDGVILSRGTSDAGTPPAQVDVARLLGGDGANGGVGGVSGGTPTAGGGAGSGGVSGSTPIAGGAMGSGGADAGADLGGVPTQNGCTPPFENNVCDPVCNTGCPALSRCNVTEEPRTGKCIGIWISGEGDLCLKTSITDPCASRLTCVDGSCRRLCYRDADCASPGSCCGQDLLLEGQASGYKICVACPR